VQKGGLPFGTPTVESVHAIGDPPILDISKPYLTIRPRFGGSVSQAPKLESGSFELTARFPNPYGSDWGVVSVLTSVVVPQGAQVLGDYVSGPIRSVVRAWAEDGRLFTGYIRFPSRLVPPPEDDPNETTEAAIIANAGWPLAYVSMAKHEALFFYQDGQVLAVQWGQQRYTEQNVPVTKQAAIATTIAALRDPNAEAEEAKTGRDYFLGVPFKGLFQPSPANFRDDPVPTSDVPDGIGWSGFLDQEYVDKPTWHIQSGWGGGAQVDALTGTLIRFTRLHVGHGTGGPPQPLASGLSASRTALFENSNLENPNISNPLWR
jgi:hypothetical protein